MQKNQIIASLIVMVLLVAGIGIFYTTTGHDNSGGSDDIVTITDSLGNEIEIQMPVTAVCLTNTNAAKFMQILGVADLVTAADETTISTLEDIYGDVDDVGSYKTPDGETILSSGSTILICQSSARSLKNADAIEELGIQIIRLDCYGNTMLTDLEQLVTMFGSSTQERADQYTGVYNSVVDAVLALDTNTSDDPTFLLEFLSMKKPYAASSEISKIVESIGGVNCIGILDPNATGSTSSIQAETILDYDQTYGIDHIIIRGTISNTSTARSQYDKFLDIDILYAELNAIGAGNVFVIDTDVLSGPLDYIGHICFAEALGLDVGELDAVDLVQEFNEMFGFNYDKTEFLFNIDTASS